MSYDPISLCMAKLKILHFQVLVDDIKTKNAGKAWIFTIFIFSDLL